MSLLSWERGLKFEKHSKKFRKEHVAPLVGAWIEITSQILKMQLLEVAPLVGAWIEISQTVNGSMAVASRSSRGSVD